MKNEKMDFGYNVSMTLCSHCQRNLSAEKPVRLPDAREYCAACCQSMATDAFEMETGEPFTQWIEKHPRLVMRYQPMEMNVRRMSFLFPLAGAVGGAAVFVYGCVKYLQAGFPLLYLAAFGVWMLALAGLLLAYPKATQRDGTASRLWLLRMCIAGLSMGAPVAALFAVFKFGRPAAFAVVGLISFILFGILSARGLLSYTRAQNFELTLENGRFQLRHGKHAETFGMGDVQRACVVRPGTVGATEGALGLRDGRMLSLDTCLSDLHALGVVMDLHFDRDFPPSPDDLARERRTRLRKIRGLS